MMVSGFVEPFLRVPEEVGEEVLRYVDAVSQAQDITHYDPDNWRAGTFLESPIPALKVQAVAEALLSGGFEPVTRGGLPVDPFAPGDYFDRGHGHERGTGAPLWGAGPGGPMSPFDAAGNLNLSAADMSRLMLPWGAGSATDPGGGGGGAAAQAAQRALQIQQIMEDLEMKKTGVLRDYAPYLNKAEADIARHQAGQRHDVGIYSSLMRLVPNVYARTGQATDQNYEKARQALATQDATARGQINTSFASARGRVRALVLSTSQHNPEAAETIGQGLDEISAYIGQGLASDQAGWDRVLQASHRLAEAALQAASTATVGEAARTGRQTLRQYQNAIDDMMLEKRRLVEARDNAIQQLQDEADLAVKQLQDEWALADAARAGGGSGRAAQQAIQRFLGNMEGYTLDAARQKGISYYLDGTAGAGLTIAQKNTIAEIAMEAGELGFTNLSAYLNWAETNGPTMGGDRANQLAAYLNFVDQNPTLDGVLDEAVAQSAGTDAWYEQQVRDPDTLWAIMAATQEYASSFPNVDPREMMEWVLDQQNPRTALLGLQQGPDYGARLLAATDPAVLAGALGMGTTGFSSPLGSSRTATTPTWVGGPGNF